MITASLRNYRIAPRKFRLVADMVRGKSVDQAKLILAHAVKKGKHPLSTLLDSAIANAKNNHNIEGSTLSIKEIRVDQGLVMKRFRPVSRGMAHGIKKRTSHVHIVLAPTGEKAETRSKKHEAGSKEAGRTEKGERRMEKAEQRIESKEAISKKKTKTTKK